ESDSFGQLLGSEWLRDPWQLTSAEAWETNVPLVLGLVITGIGACLAARHIDMRLFCVSAILLPFAALLAIVLVAATLEGLAQWEAIRPLDPTGLDIFSPGWFRILGP